ncbi:sensor histidine kinase [Sutcliffiella cohnii]|uniref:sensor histidine kinase n=1 Tax=Sutcliffiella cohnii TaxID=33932 RepID=UPI002E1D2444|nr:GHKL domain-containing protein [Sutcliffiella cohnii]
MKTQFLYWGFMSFLATILTYELLSLILNDLILYTVTALLFFLTYICLIVIKPTVPNWKSTINIVFSLGQIFIVSFCLLIPTTVFTTTLLIVFILIEIGKVQAARERNLVRKEVQQFEAQQTRLNETFRILRSERHDFLKHISAIHYMLEKGSNSEAKTYLDSLVDSYEETNLSIKGETGVVAAVLHQMYKQATSKGCSVYYDLDVPISSLPLTDKDTVALISNLLTNSVEACEDWLKERDEQPLLSLQFYKRSGLYILLCKNNSLPLTSNVLDRLYDKYGVTTKGGNHEGLGTKIIHSTVQQYNGLLDFTYIDEQFSVKIKIPAIH